jgi:hypothetical protein
VNSLKPYLYVAFVLALVAAFGGGYYKGDEAASNRYVAAQAREDAIVQGVQDKVLAGVAASLANMTVKNTVIRQKATEIIREVPVYTECKNTDEIKLLIEQARTP